ncbi:MAG: glycosyltransferase [Rhizobacter sp.]
MKLLLLSPSPFGAALGQGGATACANALQALAHVHEVVMLCFSAGTTADNAALLEMSKTGCQVSSVPLKVTKFKVLTAKLRSLVTDTPEQAIYFESDAFRGALAAQLSAFKPDGVIVFFPQMAQYLQYCGSVPSAQDVQDAFSVSWYRRALTAPRGLRALYARKQWRNWVAYERKHYPRATLCWTLSEQDQYGLNIFNPGLRVRSVGIPLAQRTTQRLAVSTHAATVGFIGSFSYPPNHEAMVHFLTHIVPRVNAQSPSVEFVIAGRAPPDSLKELAPANVRFVGFVESLPEFYASCSVIVAPLLSGGGVKIKVAEALCFGKAVVTTSVGAEGMPIENGIHAMVENDPQRFAQAISELLANSALREKYEQAAGALADQTFSIDTWLSRVNHHIDQMVQAPKLALTHG